MRTIALFALTLAAAGCVTARQVVRVDSEPRGAALRVECDGVSRGSGYTPGVVALSRRAKACSVTLTRPGYAPQTTAPMNREAIKDGLLIGGLTAMGTAVSSATSHQQLEALSSGVLLAGIFILGDKVSGAGVHFEPELVEVRLDRSQ